ncbi:Hypp557 [Branchiostoma lanceolatum]|uniref:Hypp557 protein n=1 Tax=Branchiostoma lanceolatum TaxID=7740 RepID=A0A8J9VEZ9_BRALA|nr:Hypp557 [Branchiostoma lanceolatum]
MKRSVLCLLLLVCGTYSQFQPQLVVEPGDVVPLLQELQAQLDEQKAQLEDQKNLIDTVMKRSGAVYIRWGRTTCDNESLTETVYSGIAGGTAHTQTGGGTNYQCLPREPEWGTYQDDVQGGAYMYGAEYQMNEHTNFGSFPNGFAQDVPCAVCYAPTRGSKLMIPARNTCPTGWTKEYGGYLMASRYSHVGAKEYVCVDGQPETIPGGDANQNGALFYPVEARCGSLPCPSYVEGRELTCVVCTK